LTVALVQIAHGIIVASLHATDDIQVFSGLLHSGLRLLRFPGKGKVGCLHCIYFS